MARGKTINQSNQNELLTEIEKLGYVPSSQWNGDTKEDGQLLVDIYKDILRDDFQGANSPYNSALSTDLKSGCSSCSLVSELKKDLRNIERKIENLEEDLEDAEDDYDDECS